MEKQVRKKVYNFPRLASTYAHWTLDGDLLDSSGHGRTLVATNMGTPPSYALGVCNNGDSSVLLPGNLSRLTYSTGTLGSNFAANNFSVEIWARFIKEVYQYGTIAQLFDSIGWKLECYENELWLFLKDNPGGNEAKLTYVPTVAPFSDGKWHYYALVVNRTDDTARLYVDGVEVTGSPLDISALTGNIYASSSIEPIKFGHQMGGAIDEIHVCLEALTPGYILSNYRGRMIEVSPYIPGSWMKFLPSINHGNPDLEEFLLPFETHYQDMKYTSAYLASLICWHLISPKMFPAMASNFGFELIGNQYLDENSLRSTLKSIVPIYKKKGTLWAFEKILDLLGYTYTVEELYSTFVPFRANVDRTFIRSQIVEDTVSDSFSGVSLTGWNSPINNSTWEILTGRLRGTGNGSDDDLNGITIDNTFSKYYMSVQFEIASGAGANTEFGMFVQYQDSGNWARIEIRTGGSDDDYLYLVNNENGTKTAVNLGEITAILDYTIGVHTLWAYVNHSTKTFLIGIDEFVISIDHVMSATSFPATKKGLYVNENLVVDFDELLIEQTNFDLVSRIPTTYTFNRKIKLDLTNYPANSVNKFAYLTKVLPEYIPTDIRIEFIIHTATGGAVATSVAVGPTVIIA
jgi:hypothetical protein